MCKHNKSIYIYNRMFREMTFRNRKNENIILSGDLRETQDLSFYVDAAIAILHILHAAT